MTRKELKKHWPILKALKNGWVEPSDIVHEYLKGGWGKCSDIDGVLYDIADGAVIKLTKEGKEKINKAKKETNYEKENEKFETWWNKITSKSDNWTTLERMAAHDSWMEARRVFKEKINKHKK